MSLFPFVYLLEAVDTKVVEYNVRQENYFVIWFLHFVKQIRISWKALGNCLGLWMGI